MVLTSSEDPQIPPQAVIEVCLCHHVRRTARAMTRIFDEALLPLGIQASQFNILTAIAARESGSATDIARLLAMDRTTLSRNLKPLRDAGYVLVSGGAGRRPSTLILTRAGQELFSQAVALWKTAQSTVTQRLGAGQTGLLLQSLEATAKVLG